jgi:hypothetical protein
MDASKDAPLMRILPHGTRTTHEVWHRRFAAEGRALPDRKVLEEEEAKPHADRLLIKHRLAQHAPHSSEAIHTHVWARQQPTAVGGRLKQ